MRANEFITEVFQPGKTNWEWARLGTNEVSAFFKVGNREYLWQAFTSVANPKKWEIQFRLIRKPDEDPDELDLFGRTGTGNSAEVMSTAVDITRAFLKEYGLDRVEEITFNAKEDSRIALYAKMIKRLLPDWDLYSRKDSVNGMTFSLTDRRAYDKPENQIGEASYEGNLGMMEMMKFFKIASQDEKDLMKSLLSQGKQEEAWKLLQQVTDTELVGEDFTDSLKKGIAAGAIALGSLGAGNADAKTNHPVMKPGTYQKVDKVQKIEKPESNAYNVLSNNSTNEITVHKAAKKAGLKGAELAQFLAQMKHESWDFNRLKEKAQPGVKGYFAKRYDMKYSPKTAKILGNTKVGDGEKYHGRGFVQLTGRDNYRMASEALGIDLLHKPELAAKPEVAAKIAVWYWQTRVKPHVNNFADTESVTKRINPALRGVQDRHENFKDYMRII